MIENGHRVCHSLFTDREADALISAWDVAWKERIIQYIGSESVTKEEWMDLYEETPSPCTRDEWAQHTAYRQTLYQYVHIYYFHNKLEPDVPDSR